MDFFIFCSWISKKNLVFFNMPINNLFLSYIVLSNKNLKGCSDMTSCSSLRVYQVHGSPSSEFLELCHMIMVPPWALVLSRDRSGSWEPSEFRNWLIISDKWLEKRGQIRRVEHWLGQQNQEGFVELGKMRRRCLEKPSMFQDNIWRELV